MTVKSFEALASGETLELRFYEPIGRGMFFDGVTATTVSDQLAANPGVRRVVCKFNSPGGNAYEGIAIGNILSALECETVAEIQGVAASAASIAAMGCKTVKMGVGSSLMIHESRCLPDSSMSADDLRRALAATEALNDNLAAIYSKRTGKSVAEVRKMLAAETWLTADKAVAEGFADEVMGTEEDADAMAFAASFDFKSFGYKHVPAKFTAQVAPAQQVLWTPIVTSDNKIAWAAYPASGNPEATTGLPSQGEIDAAKRLVAAQQVPQPSAALDAEAFASRKRETMTIKLIAQAIGLQADADESAVMSAVQKVQAFVAELKTATKEQSFEAMIGAVRGFQAAADQLPALKAQIDEQTKQLEDQERAAVFAADKADAKGRKLTPALEAHWATRPVAELKAFMAVAPHLVQVTDKPAAGTSQPVANTEAAAGTNDATVEVLTHNGKSWEALSNLEKHDLHETDKARYEALKRNFAERGSPRAQSQQQRASA